MILGGAGILVTPPFAVFLIYLHRLWLVTPRPENVFFLVPIRFLDNITLHTSWAPDQRLRLDFCAAHGTNFRGSIVGIPRVFLVRIFFLLAKEQ